MRNYLKLFLYCFILYVFFGHFMPYITSFFPQVQIYADKANEYGIEAGALYYTDVSVSLDSERANREAVIKAYGSSWGWKKPQPDSIPASKVSNAKPNVSSTTPEEK